MQYKESGIILVGVSCRAPNANNISEFWEQLMSGMDMTSETTPRWPAGLFGLPKRAGLIPDISRMDADAFGLTDQQVINMDPQLRLLMETTMEAIFDAGLPFEIFSSRRTGIYTHNQLSEYGMVAGEYTDTHSGVFANRLAGLLKASGPTMTLDSACSSALVGLHVACTQLHEGIIDIAIISGSNLILSPVNSLQSFRMGMLSAESASRPWDQSAKGYVRAEGVYSLVVTRRNIMHSPAAVPRVYAEVVASSTNSDGYTPQGITYPSKDSQVMLLNDIYCSGGVDPRDLAYVECHATGTQAGDPVETQALCEVLCRNRQGLPALKIGTCKSNKGHAEWTAGLASICKAILCINKKTIPPTINLENINENIPGLIDGRIQAVTAPTTLPDGLVGVTSSGFGGSNCHVVLKPIAPLQWRLSLEKLVLLGSRTSDGMTKLVQKVQSEVESTNATYVQAFLSHVTRGFTRCSVPLPYRNAFIYSGGKLTKISEGTVLDKPTKLMLHVACVTTIPPNSEFVADANLHNGARRMSMVLDFLEKLIKSEVRLTLGRTSGLSNIIKLFLDQRLGAEQCVDLVNLIESWMENDDVTDLGLLSPMLIDSLKEYLALFRIVHGLSCREVDQIVYGIAFSRGGGVSIDVHGHEITLEMTSHGLHKALGQLYCLGVPVRPMQDVDATIPSNIPPIGHLLHWDHNVKWPVSHWTQFCSLGGDVSRPPYVIPGDVTPYSLVYHIYKAVAYFKDLPDLCVSLEHFSPPCWNDVSGYVNAEIYCLTGGERAFILKGDRLLMQVCYKIVSDESSETLFTEEASYNRSETFSVYTDSWNVIWAGDWSSYMEKVLKPVLNIRPHSLSRIIFDSRRVRNTPHLAYWNSCTGVCNAPGLFVQFMEQGTGRTSRHVERLTEATRALQETILTSQLDDFSTGANIGDKSLDYQCLSSAGTPSEETTSTSVTGEYEDNPFSGQVTPSNVPRNLEGEERTLPFKTPSSFSANQMLVHCLKMYHFHNESTFQESWLLAFCGKQNGKHCLGVTVIQRQGTPISLCSPVAIPMGVSCNKVVSSVVPFMLAECIHRKSLPSFIHAGIKSYRVVVISKHISMLLVNLLRKYVGDQVIVCMPGAEGSSSKQEESRKYEIKVEQSSPGGACGGSAVDEAITPGKFSLTPSGGGDAGAHSMFASTPLEAGFLQSPATERRALQLSSVGSSECRTAGSDTLERGFIESTSRSPNTSPFGMSDKKAAHLAAVHKAVARMREEMSKNYSPDSLRISTTIGPEDLQSPCAGGVPKLGVWSLAAMFPEATFVAFDELAPANIRANLSGQRINIIVNLTDRLQPWLSLMDKETAFLQVGLPHSSCDLGIDVCKACGTFMSLNPVALLQQVSYLDEAWANGLWAIAESMDVTWGRDSCYQYTSNPSTRLVTSVTLQVVYKHVMKVLQSGTSFEDLEWLGHLKCLASVNNQNTSGCIPRHRSMLSAIRSNVRDRSPVPQVYVGEGSKRSATPINLDDSREDEASIRGRSDSASLQDSGVGLKSPVVEYVVPLSKPPHPSPLVALNNVGNSTTSPIFLVHPVTGVLNILRWLGQAWKTTRCYGIQQTEYSPVTSIPDLAKYYLDECLHKSDKRPLKIVGYSFGAALAFEMAAQAQARHYEVAPLVLLDGSPYYVKLPLIMIRESNPPEKLQAVMETELMLAFMQLYSSVDPNSVRHLLEKSTNRMKLAAEYTVIAETKGSCLNQWLVAAHRALTNDQSCAEQARSMTFTDVSESVVYKNRLERAEQFVNNMTMVDRWDISGRKFNGDIHLFRLTSPPRHCVEMPEDYGLKEVCNGQLHIKSFSTTHEGLVLPPCCDAVAADITDIFKATN